MAKLGRVVVVVVFGALMFVTGLLAPATLRQAATALFAATSAAPATPKGKVPTKTAAASSKTNGKAKEKTKEQPIPYEALLIPTPPPPDGKYALQLALQTDIPAAEALAKRASDSGYPGRALPVVDQNGTRWTAVAAGIFKTPEDARAARVPLSRKLELTQPLPIILLPPEKKKKETG